MQVPYATFKGPTCRGARILGTACGHCEKCKWELANTPPVVGWPPTAAQPPVYQQMPRPTDGAFTILQTSHQMGCICPPGSNKDCEAPLCPRKNHLKAKE